VQLLDNLFGDVKTKAHAVVIHVVPFLDLSEQLEELHNVVCADAHTCVFYFHFESLLVPVEADEYTYGATGGVLESVASVIAKNLEQTLLVS